MPFLLGMCGPITQSSQKNNLRAIAAECANQETIQVLSTDKCLIYAGNKKNDALFSDTITTLGDQGFFVGKLFDRHRFLPALFTHSDAHVLTKNPKIIMKDWWGRYAGALYNKEKQRCTLVRDPQGLSTLFYKITPDGVIFSTDMSLLYDVLEEKPSLNAAYLAEYVIGHNYALSSTSFNEIQELLPGMSLHIQADGSCSIEQLWDISELKGSFIANTDEFEHTLLATMKASLKAWVGDSSGICLELSGGADSSGLMILLRNILPEHKNIIGINYIDSKTPTSNEVVYAQEVADICNAPLHFLDWQDSSLLDPLPTSWRPDKPTTFLMFYNTSRQLHELAERYNCSTIMNGQGGDHVFLAPQPTESLADYWLDKGLRGITKPLKELSNANRMPWWMLMRDTTSSIATYYSGRKSKNETSEPVNYFNPALHYNKTTDDFYLDKSMSHFYPAKKSHVKSLFHAQSYADRNQRMDTRIITHPLLSQPIVELGLQIPTYQSFNNGFDRIFFRNSVSRIKKPKALWRSIKGETTSSMAKSFATHAQEVQDIVLQGYFAQNGLLNNQWFIEEMAKIRHGQIQNLWPVIKLLTSQLWINQWKL